MPDPPIRGANSQPPGDEDNVDGVVLYDPTPPESRFGADADTGGRSPSIATVTLVLAAVALGGYQLFFRTATTNPELPTVPTMVSSGMDPVEAVLSPIGGAEQSAEVGTIMTLPVRARGTAGTPLADSLVQFVILTGDAVLDPDTARTDSNGIARVELTLPQRAGEHLVVARLVGSTLEARIVVKGQPGPPARLVAAAGNGQEAEVGELLRFRPTVTVTDEVGNPTPGVEVLFDASSGQGTAAPGRMRTDSLGTASALWRLGVEIGTQELHAIVRATGETVTFRANALGRPVGIEGGPRTLERGPVIVARRNFVIGGSVVCSLAGSSADCRGANDRGQSGVAAASGLVALAAGVSHICGLDSTGEAVCWGANEGGQLGDGTRTDRSSPVPVRAELLFSSLTAGAAHTCGVAGGGVAVCWGQNLSGQLGDGSRTDARFPRAVGGGILFRQLVAGWNHTCGLTSNGNAFCWGPNSEGQLGDGSRLDRLTPALVGGSIESLAAGSNHTCGIGGNGVLCWGDNRFGQVGDGTNEGRSQPEEVAGLPSRALELAAGAVHTCAIVADGSAYCWGQNLRGQLGTGDTQNRNRATLVVGGHRFSSIHAGGALTCGITTAGEQYCWGLNQDGQLGDGTRESRSSPVRVSD
ncbi:MAG: hypothetical protein OEO79_15675 [Gemmatimonadota bacterium]|nr:hypothetical protein [Gemmatimonadota bacterium]